MTVEEANAELALALRVIDGRDGAPMRWAVAAGCGEDPVARAWATSRDEYRMRAIARAVLWPDDDPKTHPLLCIYDCDRPHCPVCIAAIRARLPVLTLARVLEVRAELDRQGLALA